MVGNLTRWTHVCTNTNSPISVIGMHLTALAQQGRAAMFSVETTRHYLSSEFRSRDPEPAVLSALLTCLGYLA
jgi:hypothetical protein